MEPEFRRAARLLVLDSSHRVLLFQYARPTGERYWATPGGGLEAGEDFGDAAVREALEELGLKTPELTVLLDQVRNFHLGERSIRQEERLFLTRQPVPKFAESVLEVHRREGVLHVRWWPLGEIESSMESIFPEDLASILRGVVSAGKPNGGQ